MSSQLTIIILVPSEQRKKKKERKNNIKLCPHKRKGFYPGKAGSQAATYVFPQPSATKAELLSLRTGFICEQNK